MDNEERQALELKLSMLYDDLFDVQWLIREYEQKLYTQEESLEEEPPFPLTENWAVKKEE